MYFKIAVGTNIVGAVNQTDFCRIQGRRSMVMYCPVEDAQYAVYEDILYHDNWLRSVEGQTVEYTQASISEIAKEEYDALIEALETQDEIPYEEPELESVIPDDAEPDDVLEFVRSAKLAEMSRACNQVIENGFDIQLSDEKTYHFSLETTDQIKIQALAMKAEKGESPLPWHADGELCCFYQANDILSIYAEMEKMQTWHTTYFNSLKAYIESLDNVSDISAVTYGTEIPYEYQSEVLKYLIGNLP